MRRPKSELRKNLAHGRLKLGRLLWIVIAAVCVGISVLPALLMLERATVVSRHSFTGSLHPVAAPVAVTLPQGAYLKEILVERNEVVYAGQTVALLDEEAINARIGFLENRLLHDEALRACLMSDNAPFQGHSGILKETTAQQDAIQTAEKECLESHQLAWEKETSFREALALIETDQALLESYVNVLVEDDDVSAVDRQETVLQILSLKAAQNRLLERKQALQKEDLSAREDRGNARRAQVTELTASMQADADQLRRLQNLLKEPRLLAPERGQILRLRRFPSGTAAVEDTEFLEIRPENTQGYLASFPVLESHRDFVAQEQAVSIELLGMGAKAPKLWGRIDRIDLAKDGIVTAFVQLHAESTLALDNPDNGIALRGDSTAAVVQVEFAEFSAMRKVLDELKEAVVALGFASPNEPSELPHGVSGGYQIRATLERSGRMLAAEFQ